MNEPAKNIAEMTAPRKKTHGEIIKESPVKDINALPQNYLRECFSYDPKEGILRWKRRPANHFNNAHQCAAWNSRLAGKEAGAKKCRKRSDHRSTIQVCVSGQIGGNRLKVILYSAHRLIWNMVYGDVPMDKVIDHINNDPWDNRISNLRLVFQKENCRNRGASFGKASKLPRNVFFIRGKYSVKLTVGTFDTVREALTARIAAERTLFGDVIHGADFSELDGAPGLGAPS